MTIIRRRRSESRRIFPETNCFSLIFRGEYQELVYTTQVNSAFGAR